MEHYSGFDAAVEPLVGEVRALRTFRVAPDGRLHSLFSPNFWDNGTNTAGCSNLRVLSGGVVSHPAPQTSCTCGFYAYGNVQSAREYPHAEHVLAVTACWGHVIAGTRGIRAQHSKVEALWLSDRVPADLRSRVVERYPSVAIYRDRAAMLTEHPPTALDCYEPAPPDRRSLGARLFDVGALMAIGLSAVSARLLGGADQAGPVWWVTSGIALVVALALGRWRTHTVSLPGRRLLFWTVVLWVTAPLFGTPGALLVQVPMVAGGLLVLLVRAELVCSARQFPANLG
jgi:hypothetical protein